MMYRDKFSLFIGIGFLVNALIDLFHVTVSLLNIDNMLFLKYFIPQTWFAGRLFLSAMFAIAIFKYNSFFPYLFKYPRKTTTTNIFKQEE